MQVFCWARNEGILPNVSGVVTKPSTLAMIAPAKSTAVKIVSRIFFHRIRGFGTKKKSFITFFRSGNFLAFTRRWKLFEGYFIGLCEKII